MLFRLVLKHLKRSLKLLLVLLEAKHLKHKSTAIRKSAIKSALESRIFDFAKQIIPYGTFQAKQKHQKTSY
jgi:hypothetical protein